MHHSSNNSLINSGYLRIAEQELSMKNPMQGIDLMSVTQKNFHSEQKKLSNKPSNLDNLTESASKKKRPHNKTSV
jgi:hypothetical protein